MFQPFSSGTFRGGGAVRGPSFCPAAKLWIFSHTLSLCYCNCGSGMRVRGLCMAGASMSLPCTVLAAYCTILVVLDSLFSPWIVFPEPKAALLCLLRQNLGYAPQLDPMIPKNAKSRWVETPMKPRHPISTWNMDVF